MNPALGELAAAAGLVEHWQDYRGQPQRVGEATLVAVLATLGLPAATPAQQRDSLRALQQERLQAVPALLVGRAGAPLPLPPALAAAGSSGWQLHLEHGGVQAVQPQPGAGGLQLVLQAPPGYHRLCGPGVEAALALAPAAAMRPLARRFALAAQLYGLRREGELGIGDFTALAVLAQRLGEAGGEALAISPVHALFAADPGHFSPYSPSSRLFLNVLHIDPATLAGQRWLQQQLDARGLQPLVRELAAAELVDWPRAATLKLQLLRALWQDFASLDGGAGLRESFDGFVRDGGSALAEHARFEALHARQFGADPTRWHWRDWPAGYRDPRHPAVERFAAEHADEVALHAFLQWLASRGLDAAQRAARTAGMGIGLITDFAVGTDSGGSHAWARQQDLLAGVAIGAPPDALNRRGQDWGLTTFSPRALQQHGHAPFIELLRASLRHAGGVRIDHVLGLNRLWVVPAGADATAGAYLRYPLSDLLGLVALEAHRHGAMVVGEDLGTVPDGFREQLHEAGVLGMRVLWFERDHGLFVEPARWPASSTATTTTHDLPPVAGWWRGHDIDLQQAAGLLPDGHDAAQDRMARGSEREALWAAFRHAGLAASSQLPGPDETGAVVDAAIDFVAATPAPLAVVPLEDLLGQVEPPNLPGSVDGNPNWRRRMPATVERLFDDGAVAARLRRLAAVRGR
jgi:4-alpha-glucanotransferase